MYALDFEFDGKNLSDYGFIVCNFSFKDGAQVADTGSEITFTKVPKGYGAKFGLTSATYSECLSCQFDICKDPELYDQDMQEIDQLEFREISRWLNRRGFHRFHAISWDEPEFPQPYYNVSFNLTKITIGEKLFGISLILETDSPFGYSPEKWQVFNFTDTKKNARFFDTSDEIGYTYPNLIIRCDADGDLTVENDVTGCSMQIKNCSSGEIITIYGESLIIESSVGTHNLSRDFNFDFFRFGNSFSNRANIISVSIPCQIRMGYSAIIRDVF